MHDQAPRVIRKAVGKPNVAASSSENASFVANAASTSVLPERPTTPVAQSATVSSLKRKRDGESKASPPGVKPIVLIRKVVPGMFGTTKSQSSPAPSTRSLAKPSGKIQMRKVVDRRKPTGIPSPKAKATDTESTPLAEPVFSPSGTPPQTQSPRAGSLNTPSHVPLPGTGPGPESIISLDPHTVVSEESPQGESQASGLRRLTRARTSAQTTDVFGTIASATATRPLQQRRRQPAFALPDGAFTGMSALALKSLTSANTTRNQTQVAELRTEIIRKEGSRPESPTTKVKTVAERQREEKVLQRQARAQRRAQRDGSIGATDADGTDDDESDDTGDNTDMHVEGEVLLKHRRGPGEEEDYETPQRPERPMKRGRFEEEEEGREEKRVKWDRGLATTVWLDDSPPKSRRTPREELTKKGCLTPAAKVSLLV